MIRRLLGTMVAFAALIWAAPAGAGNIAITGHDDDFHCTGTPATDAACNQLNGMVTFARAGSSNPTLPVLTFDEGSQLTNALTGAGIAFTNINTIAGINAALFDPTVYSAFAVASHTSCGGCDNSTAFVNAIIAQSAAITSFFNAGGGVVGLAGAGLSTYYNFVPESSASLGGAPASGYVQDTCGVTFGIVAVNNDATHNHFSEPGTGGVSSLYCVAERNPTGLPSGQNAMTLLLQGGIISTGVITTTSGAAVPEPATLLLVGGGLAMAARRLRRKQ
jgi:hypothetical protein